MTSGYYSINEDILEPSCKLWFSYKTYKTNWFLQSDIGVTYLEDWHR